MKLALCPLLATLLTCTAGSAYASGVIVHAVDAQGQPLIDVVLYAEPESIQPLPRPLNAAEIEQKNLTFIPLVSVIQTGSRITFPNHDKVRHHIYSFSPAKRFDQKLYSGESAAPQIFDKAGTVVLGCNIHDAMLAYIKVVDTPYFAKTDSAGDARFEAPAGKYTLKAWHYNMAASQPQSQHILIKGGEALTPSSVKIVLKRIVTDPTADSSN
jgi:plastocyanin